MVFRALFLQLVANQKDNVTAQVLWLSTWASLVVLKAFQGYSQQCLENPRLYMTMVRVSYMKTFTLYNVFGS